MAVLRSSLTPPVPYAIFETREDGDGFGFMHDTPAFYERFSTEDMVRLVKVLYGFHRSGFDIDPNILTLTRKMSAQLSHYQREFKKLLDTRILHRAADGTETTASVEQLLVRYTGLPDVRTRISLVLEKNFTFVGSSRASKGVYLVHADMQIDNVYRHRDGEFELLDFEWVGRSDNPVVAIMFDYGNLRARAWSSPSFQFTLDTVMVDVGKHIYSGAEDMLRAALILGTLRSSLLMSRFHLDFENTVKKDKRSEEEYFAMYPSTVAALARVLV